MKHKKTVISILFYIASLVLVIGIFLVFQAKSQSQDDMTYYVANAPVEAGITIDSTTLKNFSEVKGSKAYADRMKENGVSLVTNLNGLLNQKVTSRIARGDILTNYHFSGSVVQSIYTYDYTTPTSMTISVSAEQIPATGVAKGQKIALVSYSSLASLGYTDITTDNDSIDKGKLLAVIAEKAEIYDFVKTEGHVSSVTVVAEQADILKAMSITDISTIYIMDNTNGTLTEDIALINYNVLKEVFSSSGITGTTFADYRSMLSNLNPDATSSKKLIDYVIASTDNKQPTTDDSDDSNSSSNGTGTNKDDKTNEVDKTAQVDTVINKGIESVVLGANDSYSISWFGYFPNIYINHYSLKDGQDDKLQGIYSVNRNDFLYDSRTEKFTLKQAFDVEGYYSIEFFDNKNVLKHVVKFIVEKQGNYAYKSTSKLQLRFDASNNTYSPVETNYLLTKDYYSTISDLDGYNKETSLSFNDFRIGNVIKSLNKTTKSMYLEFMSSDINNAKVYRVYDLPQQSLYNGIISQDSLETQKAAKMLLLLSKKEEYSSTLFGSYKADGSVEMNSTQQINLARLYDALINNNVITNETSELALDDIEITAYSYLLSSKFEENPLSLFQYVKLYAETEDGTTFEFDVEFNG